MLKLVGKRLTMLPLVMAGLIGFAAPWVATARGAEAAQAAVAHPFPPSDLYLRFAKRGVKPETTSHLRFAGDESSNTAGVKLTIAMPETVETVWRSIVGSKRYGVWYASGYRRLEFHSKGSKDPAAVLLVNESDQCFLSGDPDAAYAEDSKREPVRFRCLGLHAYLMRIVSVAEENKRLPVGDDLGLHP